MNRKRFHCFQGILALSAALTGCGGSRGAPAIKSSGGLENAVEHDIIKGAADENALIDTTYFGQTQIWYKAVGQYGVTDGDIVLGDLDSLRNKEKLVKVGALWPAGKVPFTIDDNLPEEQRVADAIASWESKTGLAFMPRNNEADYVTFKNGVGCSSRIGRIGGQQFVTLGPGCTTGNAIHEIGHTLGLWHEQSRDDREDNIIIHREHVEDGFEHNFDTRIKQKIGFYNFGSIMHYPADAFSKDGQPTIELKQAGVFVTIGQRDNLSPGDWIAVGTLYCELEEPSYPCAIPMP